MYIPSPFPPGEGDDHILAVATVASGDTPHLKPWPVQDWHGGHFPFSRLLRHLGTTLGLFFSAGLIDEPLSCSLNASHLPLEYIPMVSPQP